MTEKILLIAGCSHTGGSEIDGSQDSKYNWWYTSKNGTQKAYKHSNGFNG